MEQAQTLEAALQNLDHLSPLTEEADLEKFFVARDEVRELLQGLTKRLEVQYPAKMLFTGHRGGGKTSTLNALARELNERGKLWVVQVSVERILDVNDLDHLDILFQVAVAIIKKSREQRLQLDPAIGKRLNAWLETLEPRITPQQRPSVLRRAAEWLGVGVEVLEKAGDVLPDDLGWITRAAGMLAAIAERIGPEQFTRNNLREGLKPGLSEMLSVIDDLSQAIYKTTKRRVVCFVDGADRSSRKTQLELFHLSGHNLAAPNISLVYTIELSLRYMNEFKQIEQLFVDYGLPNLKYQEPNTAQTMQEMLTRRAKASLFAEGSLAMLVKYSGGVPRILIQLANSACLDALVKNQPAITTDNVRDAVQEERRQYQRMLSQAQRELLQALSISKDIKDNKTGYLELLLNLSVLEYANGDTWWDVNPIVLDILEKKA